jgi:hypothetical protein
MGKYLFDQYSLLHFAQGISAYFWGMKLKLWIIVHFIFEIIENTEIGINIINKIKLWPGGKPKRDANLNILGDNIAAILGWLCAYYIDKKGSELGWYEKHIN